MTYVIWVTRWAARGDPHERPRLEETRVNLIARIAEAEREGRPGEVDGPGVSLAAAEHKLARPDAELARPGGCGAL
ncbi:hypothetical protein ACIRYZ_41355 [Kitasatospora sp. NPDC101155]|uniref:hypothetical protein n=1 Tax=Kitasatospora sp. NPDC101155 TaxID=3364097 RepID=UPI003803F71C